MKKVLFSLASAASLLLMVDVQNAQAAQFEFSYGSRFILSETKVTLGIFFETPEVLNTVKGLTGIGEESISLSELERVNFGFDDNGQEFYNFILFKFEGKVFDTIFDGFNDVTRYSYIGDPVFYFDAGNLVGIDLDTETIGYSLGDCRSFPCFIESGTFRDEIKRDTVTRYYTGTLLEVEDPFTETITDFERVETIPVGFTTITPIPFNPNEPVASVPEPFSIFSLGTLMAFSSGLKRKSS